MNPSLRAWLFVSLAPLAAVPALAFDFVPTRYDDPVPDGCLAGDCSLREAISDANAGGGADRILLSAGVYAVGLDGLAVTSDLEIVGAGAGITVLDGTSLGINQSLLGASGLGLDFALQGVTVRNSNATGVSLGTGTHTIEECEVSGNGSTSNDGGIVTSVGTVATLRRLSLVGNSGYGLLAVQSSITVENSTFSGNDGRELQVVFGGTFTCTHCTILDPADDEPELTLFESPATFANSIIDGDCLVDATSAVDSLGGDIESPGNTCRFDAATDQNSKTSGELALGALADNGGPTHTHLPGASSVATGGAFDTLCLAGDQRGVARAADCESGSVERTSVHVETPIFVDGFLQGNPKAWSATVP